MYCSSWAVAPSLCTGLRPCRKSQHAAGRVQAGRATLPVVELAEPLGVLVARGEAHLRPTDEVPAGSACCGGARAAAAAGGSAGTPQGDAAWRQSSQGRFLLTRVPARLPARLPAHPIAGVLLPAPVTAVQPGQGAREACGCPTCRASRSSRCAGCGNVVSEVKKCGGCRAVAYCSCQCQVRWAQPWLPPAGLHSAVLLTQLAGLPELCRARHVQSATACSHS